MARHQQITLRHAEIEQLDEVKRMLGFETQREAISFLIDLFWTRTILCRPGDTFGIMSRNEFRPWSGADLKAEREEYEKLAREIEAVAKYASSTGRNVIIVCDSPEKTAMFTKLHVSYRGVDAYKSRMDCGRGGRIAFVNSDECPHPRYDVKGFEDAEIYVLSIFTGKLRGGWVPAAERDKAVFDMLIKEAEERHQTWLQVQREEAEGRIARAASVAAQIRAGS